MTVNSSERYFNSIVQVCDAAGRVYGAGVLVDQTTVITCAHVVAAAFGKALNAPRSALPAEALLGVRRMNVDGAASQPRVCRLTRYSPRQLGSAAADLALLEPVEGSYDVAGHAVSSFIDLRTPVGVQICVYGFPEDAHDTIDQTVPAIYDLIQTMPNGWYSAVASRSYGQEIRQGFSGAPVMERNSGLLVGIVCEADPAPERRTATIIPTRDLLPLHWLPLEEQPAGRGPEAAGATAVPHTLMAPGMRFLLEWAAPGLHYVLTARLRLLADPPERAALQQYIAEHKAVWTDELASKTYLPPPAKQLPDTPAQIVSQLSFFTPIQQLIREIAGVSSGGDSASAQISALSRRSSRIRNLVDRLLSSPEPLIVLGDPGSGKSMTLKQAAIALSDRNARRVFPSLCVFIPLGRWRPSERPDLEDVERLVESALPPELRPLLLPLAGQERMVVIFDGLDEMSRERYTEQTVALSRYAETYRGRIRTLFSCRVADFSPAFQHRRLVLLPFGRRHIQEYLTRQFGRGKIELNGARVSIARAARDLDTQNLPIQPQNPFSLWLLSLYIRENKALPDTRVTLLEFLYDYQFDRKRVEAEERGESFPAKAEIFGCWARLARAITARNRGSDIGLHEVGQLFGPAAAEIVAAGRSCGVLQQSLDHNPPLVRFEHHRAQEYFTAYDIVHGHAEIDWERYLDVPRWQETLVNVAQMEGGQPPLLLVGESLGRISAGGLEQLAGLERAQSEALAAERLELGGRLLRAIKESPERDQFAAQMSQAAAWLGQHGNPVSVVKVLRLAQDLPQLRLFDTVKAAMKHPVAWVREQAEVVAVTLAGKAAASPLPESIVSSFSDGSILKSQPHYQKVARHLKSPAVAVVAMLAALLLLLQAGLVGALGPLAAKFFPGWFDWHVLVPKGDPAAASAAMAFFSLWGPRIAIAATLLALIGSLVLQPKYHWFAPPVACLAALLVTMLVYCSWAWSSHLSLGSLLSALLGIGVIAYVAYAVTVLLVLVFGVVVWICSSLCLAGMVCCWTRDTGGIAMTFRTTWVNGVYDDCIDLVKDSWKQVLTWSAYVAAGMVIAGIEKTRFFKWLASHAYHFPLCNGLVDVLLNLTLAATLVGGLYWLLAWGVSRLLHRSSPGPMVVAAPLIAFAGVYVFFSLLPAAELAVFHWINRLLGRWLGNSAAIVIWGLISLLLLALLAATAFLLYRLLVAMYYFARRHWILGVVHYTPEQFRIAIKEAEPQVQAILLNSVSPGSLTLDPQTFLELLIEVEPAIQQEPALGRYWAKRAETQDLVRHERHN